MCMPLRVFFCCTSLPLAGNLGRLTWIRHSSHRSSTIHSYRCAQYFPVSKQWYGCQCLGFLMCTQMLMHVIACRDCADTRRESALKVDWEKNPLLYWRLEPQVINAPGFLFQWATNWAVLPHALLFMLWFAVGNWPNTTHCLWFMWISIISPPWHTLVILRWSCAVNGKLKIQELSDIYIEYVCVHNIVKL